MWNTTAIENSGVQQGTLAGDAVAMRESVLKMTDVAEAAVLRPADPGAWPHALRASLASRAARLNGLTELADRYHKEAEKSEYESLSNTNDNGASHGLETVISFMDKVATRPREVTIADVQALQETSINDADIVKLSELNAFMAYQIRLVAGLTMLSGITK